MNINFTAILLMLLLPVGASTKDSEKPFILFLVDAPRFDYSDTCSFLRSMAKRPGSLDKRGEVGHAWVYLQGNFGNALFTFEGGHSGELGIEKLTYCEGVESSLSKKERDPVSYLWEALDDGYLERGSGGHLPTAAVRIELSEEQFSDIVAFTSPLCYPYHSYSLTRRQCVSFVVQVAALAAIDLEVDSTLLIEQEVTVNGCKLRLWSDPRFASISFASPDRLEEALKALVREGKAEDALGWYLQRHPKGGRRESFWQKASRFPSRILRYGAFAFSKTEKNCVKGKRAFD